MDTHIHCNEGAGVRGAGERGTARAQLRRQGCTAGGERAHHPPRPASLPAFIWANFHTFERVKHAVMDGFRRLEGGREWEF